MPTPPRHAFRLRSLYRDGLEHATLPMDGLICALPVPDAETNRLGIDARGEVCILLTVAAGHGAARPDVSLQNLKVQRRVTCQIRRPTGQREELTGVLVTCRADSSDLLSFFLDLFDQALETLGAAPTEQAVDAWIEHAAKLFAELDDRAHRDIRGLWGELLVIANAHEPALFVRRWHEDPQDTFDFISGDFAVEVKSCRDLERVHVFSLAQLRPTTSMDVIVASVPLRDDPSGPTAIELMSEIESRMPDPAQKAKLRETAFRVGGASLAESPRRFDRKAAVAGLRFIRASLIPAFDESMAPEILTVQLTIRCRDILDQDLHERVSQGLK